MLGQMLAVGTRMYWGQQGFSCSAVDRSDETVSDAVALICVELWARTPC